MSELRGWGLPESHLLPDAVVAYVDGELSLGAQDRAASHVARCPSCAAEVGAQRQARAAVKRAESPSMSAGFLDSLRSIPEHTEVSTTPDNLAITEDGQLVAIQRPDRVAGLRSSGVLGGPAPLGSSAPLGNSPNVLGSARRRAAQGAGVVVSGLVLSALALVATSGGGGTNEVNTEPVGGTPPNVLRAQFGGVAPPPTTSLSTPTTSLSTPLPTPLPTGTTPLVAQR
ncbi:anti-sigma factor family protein [Amycolatopsis nigrescens]|uniref:anti-sigma factor family protein n=1 Tax=Amycolatopsis nigrescens TaxID=381445 RepID=UPI0003779BAC|nr:zf-HC2 domain-containing protein [Amycolatopsis nigrescens]